MLDAKVTSFFLLVLGGFICFFVFWPDIKTQNDASTYVNLGKYTEEGTLTGGYSCAPDSQHVENSYEVIAVEGTRAVVRLNFAGSLAIYELDHGGWVEKYRASDLIEGDPFTFVNHAVLRGDFLAVDQENTTRVFSIRPGQVTLIGDVTGNLIDLEEITPGQMRLFVNTGWNIECGETYRFSERPRCPLAFEEYEVRTGIAKPVAETKLFFNVSSRRGIAIAQDRIAFAQPNDKILSGYEVLLMNKSEPTNLTYSILPQPRLPDAFNKVSSVKFIGNQILVVRGNFFGFIWKATLDVFANVDGVFHALEPFPRSIMQNIKDAKIQDDRVAIKYDIVDDNKSTQGIRVFQYSQGAWNEDKSLAVSVPADLKVTFAFDRTGRLVYTLREYNDVWEGYNGVLMTLPDACARFSGVQIVGIVASALAFFLSAIFACIAIRRAIQRSKQEKPTSQIAAKPEH